MGSLDFGSTQCIDTVSLHIVAWNLAHYSIPVQYTDINIIVTHCFTQHSHTTMSYASEQGILSVVTPHISPRVDEAKRLSRVESSNV